MTKISHAAFPPPEMSLRRKMSAKILIRSQNHAIQRKKNTIIVQRTSRNG